MKTYINVSKKINYLILLPIGLVVTITFLYLSKKRIEWEKEKDLFKSLKINSKIIGLKDLNRGSYQVEVYVNGKLMSFDLLIGYEVRTDSIVVGDSLAKEEFSGKLEFYRIREKVKKISETTIQ